MRKMLVLLLPLGAVLLVAAFVLLSLGRMQFLSPESKLAAFETRIASVEDEFMRRSPELRENFTRFQVCMRRTNCPVLPILEERDRIVETLWEEMLERLLVESDWGNGEITAILHQRFREDVQKVGGEQRARHCRPKLRYYLLSETLVATNTYEGLYCP